MIKKTLRSNNYKNILIGKNTFAPDWLDAIKSISKPNIFVRDFETDDLNKIISMHNIEIIIPMSFIDYNIAKKSVGNILILFPDEITYELLNNKLEFTKWMCDKFPSMIPRVYYLDGLKIADISFPAISKPIYSSNGQKIKIYHDLKSFESNNDKLIIQKFIKYEYEYGGFFLCANGKIINYRILKYKYPKFHIKQKNFPTNSSCVKKFPIELFEPIIFELGYSGGINFDFKYNESKNKIYIFEINPRFGGSAFTNNFIYDLMCVKKI